MRVLLVENDLERTQRIRRVLHDGIGDVAVCRSAEALPPGAIDLVVANYDAIATEHRGAFFDRFSQQCAAGRLLLYVGGVERQELAVLLGERGLMNVLARADAIDPDELGVTIEKMLCGEIFGLDKYFRTGGTRQMATIRCTDQRDDILQLARDFSEAAGVPARHTDLFCTVADELTTNALYNAPRDRQGNALYAHLPRTELVRLGEGQQIDMAMCADSQRIGISVMDPYGSLSRHTVLRYLAKCFRKGDDQLDDKAGGAGLGLFQIFESVTQFVMNLEPGRATEIIGVINFTGRFRDFVVRPKSFNIFLQCRPMSSRTAT